MRRVFENTGGPKASKFQPNWEGLYMIVKVGATRSYALNKLDGTPVTKMWNVMHLKRFLLSIKFSLEYFSQFLQLPPFKRPYLWLLVCWDFQKTRCGSNPDDTFKRPDVALSLLALSKDQTKLVGTFKRPDVTLSLLALSKAQMWL